MPRGHPGVGDGYYPLDGNGGYDVAHHLLKISDNPATDRLAGWRRSQPGPPRRCAGSTLDFQGMTVRSVVVDGKRARCARSQDHELTITPKHTLKKGRRFRTVVRYDGVPRTQIDLSIPTSRCPTAGSAPTTARSWSASPRARPTGSPSTTTRPTRRPSPSS
jgi:hypothetical protein